MVKPAGVHESLGISHVLFYSDYSVCLLVVVGEIYCDHRNACMFIF